LVIFDLSLIADKATYEDPFSFPVGIDYTIVNGGIVFEQGSCPGRLPGRVIRRGKD